MKKTNTILLAGLMGLCALQTSNAMWAAVSQDVLVAENKVIVVGKIEEIQAATAGTKYDTALITVTEVLKNELDMAIKVGDKLPLAMPATGQGLMISVSTDISYKKGTAGVWLLEYKDKMFLATYPKDYQPATAKEEIVKIIKQQKEKK